MQTFIGTKLVNAEPMNRADYNELRGWELPEDENGADEGYLVEYLDGGKPNVEGYKGYVSWSPKAQFENAYRTLDKMNLGDALMLLRNGQRIGRAAWKGAYVFLGAAMPGAAVPTFYKAAGVNAAKWSPDDEDMLANDWALVQ